MSSARRPLVVGLIYRKFDFIIEGTHQAYAFRAGAFADAHCMAHLTRRW